MVKSGIYIIRNLKTRMIYIGSAADIERRWKRHRSYLNNMRHENKHLQRAWDKYGADAFKFEIIFTCCEALLIHHENRAFDIYRDDIGWDMIYNINPIAGSRLGMKNSPEHNAKIGAANKIALKGKKLSSETRVKMSKAQRERHTRNGVSRETRAKISIALTGKKLSLEHRAAISVAGRGRKASPEARANMSKAKRGNQYAKGKKHPPRSPEHCAKLSAAMKGNQNGRRKRDDSV